MTDTNLYILLSVVAVSLISLIALVLIGFRKNFRSILLYLVSFAAGALLGDVFIHLLPEMAEEGNFNLSTSLYILGSIIGFFVLERFIHWHHHHGSDESEHAHHPVAFLNLIGDGLHNLIDGMIIAGAYLVDTGLGVATTIAVMLHEIPQEIGDFGILVYGGFSRAKALFYNLLSGLTAVVGAVIVLLLQSTAESLAPILIAIASGSFIYIAIADLMPEISKSNGKAFQHFLSMVLGVAVMFSLLFIE